MGNGGYRARHSSGWFAFVAGFAIALFAGWVVFPQVLYSEKTQPFSFSHATHSEDGPAGLSCDNCHSFREDGSFNGIPSLETCFDCHTELQGEGPSEKEFYEKGSRMLEQGRETPWLIYSQQPPCVYFSHAPHVVLANLDCVACHRDVSQQKKPPVLEENRITGYSRYVWKNLKMNDCAECHREKGASDACFVCHK